MLKLETLFSCVSADCSTSVIKENVCHLRFEALSNGFRHPFVFEVTVTMDMLKKHSFDTNRKWTIDELYDFFKPELIIR